MNIVVISLGFLGDTLLVEPLCRNIKNIYPNLLEARGKNFENENSQISMTMEDFEKLESDPIEVFKYFCKEEMNEEIDEHLIEMFQKAVELTLEEK